MTRRGRRRGRQRHRRGAQVRREKAAEALRRTRSRTAPSTTRAASVDYVKHLNRDQDADPPERSSTSTARATGHEVEIAMQWNAGYSESVHTFANTINTHEGGTHEEGFRAALTTRGQQVRQGQEAAQGEGRRTSPATTSARAWPRSSRSRSASRSSRARPRPSSATPRSSRSCRRSATSS